MGRCEQKQVDSHNLKAALTFCLIPVIFTLLAWFLLRFKINAKLVCHRDFGNDEMLVCRPECKRGHFSLPGMAACMPYLGCDDFSSRNLQLLKEIGNGAVKMVHLARWQGHDVVLNSPKTVLYQDDFHHGFQMIFSLQSTLHVIQLLGNCSNKYITEYHKHQSAENIIQLLQDKFHKYNNLAVRFGLCLNYVEIVAYLHDSPIGTRVLCDSNDLIKTLNQFLVTSDFHLIINDLDALPLVNASAKVRVKCGHREIHGEFAAPEQLWPFEDEPFDDSSMPPYDEKVDIWKIPDVCQHFLGSHPEGRVLLFHLFKIHQKCKSKHPHLRPPADKVLEEYKEIWKKFGLSHSD